MRGHWKHCVPSALQTLFAILDLFSSQDLDLFFFLIFLRLSQLHVVHYNADMYYSLSKAVDKSDGLAVLGVLIKVRCWTLTSVIVSFWKAAAAESNRGCHADWRVQSSLWTFFEVPLQNQVQRWVSHRTCFSFINCFARSWTTVPLFHAHSDQKVQIPGFNIRALLPSRLDEYYRYDGSLTTPPCYPSVLWTLFRNPVTISRKQVSWQDAVRKQIHSQSRVVLLSYYCAFFCLFVDSTWLWQRAFMPPSFRTLLQCPLWTTSGNRSPQTTEWYWHPLSRVSTVFGSRLLECKSCV